MANFLNPSKECLEEINWDIIKDDMQITNKHLKSAHFIQSQITANENSKIPFSFSD
jgi:hypothetical protein